MLKGTSIERFVEQRISRLTAEHEILEKAIPSFKMTLKEYLSLVNLIYSRVFQ